MKELRSTDIIFAGVFLIFVLFISMNASYLIYPSYQVDEQEYKKIVDVWDTGGLNAVFKYEDNKPLPFLYLQKVFDGDYIKTRILNLILVLINTFLIYKLTHQYKSFLYPIIPIFLNSMWLTVETIETFFILISFYVSKYQGIFIGLAALNRPYSALYMLLERRTQLIYTLTIGVLFLVMLYFLGGISYLSTLAEYGTHQAQRDYLALFFLLPMMMTCIYNKEMFKWGLVACIPLVVRMYAHYFITPYSLFFIGYLQSKKLNNKT